MILDFKQAPAEALSGRFDIAVAGAGPAGQVVARRCAEAGKRVLLLEGGALEYTGESQELYVGEELGVGYRGLTGSRLRYFGGSTNHWGGRCRPLDRHDFDVREDVPLTGWPISYDEVAQYLPEACDILNIGLFNEDRTPVEGSETLVESYFRWSLEAPFAQVFDGAPVRFDLVWRDWFEASDAVTTVVNANVTAVEMDAAADRVTGFVVQGYDGRRVEIAADHYVVAMGGVENVRLLLNENRRHQNRLGNQGGMVGRCWMEHPHQNGGVYVITERLHSHLDRWDLMVDSIYARQKNESIVAPTTAFMRDANIMNAGLRLRRPNRRPLSEEEIAGAPFIRDLKYGEDYYRVGVIYMAWEQAPNPDSKLVLTEEKDPLGMYRVGHDWRLLDIDFRTPRACLREVAKMLIRTGLGRLRLDDEMLLPGLPDDGGMNGGNHHMGGARMSATPETGVVDGDCKVHGVDNLYVAGSAVYPTGGHANPTVNIVQLALRLAKHLSA